MVGFCHWQIPIIKDPIMVGICHSGKVLGNHDDLMMMKRCCCWWWGRRSGHVLYWLARRRGTNNVLLERKREKDQNNNKTTQFCTTIQFLLSHLPPSALIKDTEVPHLYCAEGMNWNLADAFLATKYDGWNTISTFRDLKRSTLVNYSTSWSTISTHRQGSWELLMMILQSLFAVNLY